MIQKNDLIILLTYMQKEGIDVNNQLKKVVTSPAIPLDVLKFINDNRQLDVAKFYERLRKNYNSKKSNLYINIVKEIEEPFEIITTLSSLLLQISLFSKHVEKNNQSLFFKAVRASEIANVLKSYYNNYDITEALTLLRLIKCDLKAFESIKNK